MTRLLLVRIQDRIRFFLWGSLPINGVFQSLAGEVDTEKL
jgi:hypothetical protein